MNPVTFNAEFYLAQNSDVAAAVDSGQFPDALAHFQEFGQFELRQPNAFFNPTFYLVNNPDVLRAVATGQIESAFSHFIEFGQFEGAGRAPSAELLASTRKRTLLPTRTSRRPSLPANSRMHSPTSSSSA